MNLSNCSLHLRGLLTTCVFFFLITHSFSQTNVLLPADYLQQKLPTGKQYTSHEVARFRDLGQLWGVLHYFNPKVNSGGAVTDSLALSAARTLIADPSANGFARAVEQMLTLLGDPGTGLLRKNDQQPSILFVGPGKPPRVIKLPDSTLLIAFPTLAADYIDDPAAIKGLLPSEWGDARALIFDLRNASDPGPYAEYSFLFDVMPLLTQAIAGSTLLPAMFERRVFHSGFVSQTSNTPNIYSSGWQLTAVPSNVSRGNQPPLNKPVTFVYNRFTSLDVVRQLSILRAAGLCKLVYEGNAASYQNGKSQVLNLTDSLSVQVRVSEFVLAGDRPLPLPDLYIDKVTDTSFNAFTRHLQDLSGRAIAEPGHAKSDPPAFLVPRPDRYADTLVPSIDKRLFGLYNFWNAFHYFSPYKDGLDHDWDSVLAKYVPVFLNADDSLSYMLAVRSVASETQDCHGYVNSSLRATPARKYYGAWPPVQLGFIGHKTYIVEIAKDSTQSISGLKVGDEIKHIDGRTIRELAEKWKKYLATSNPSTFERDVANYLTVGPIGSEIRFTVKGDGGTKTIPLKRSGRWPMGTGIKSFNKVHKTVELLQGNIGYVNMGSLKQSMVDSVMNALIKTKAIIFDIRNYPQGTAWSIAPWLTATAKKAVLFDKPFVNNEYLAGGEDQSTLKSHFTVNPGPGKKYAGKVIILCDENTQSQAEYTIMMFQGATKTVVIGSQTAGADGNVTDVSLPGGYSITFSGLGIYYPDGTPTQRRGIKVDIESRPTIRGLLSGKDEVLQRALQYVRTGK